MNCTRILYSSLLVVLTLLSLIFITCSEKTTIPTTIPTDEYTLRISPQGGVYTFPDGIKLRVPAGAVSENIDISLKRINDTMLQPIFDRRGVSIENLIAGIEGKPDGTTFNSPVELILSVDLEPGQVPIVHEVDIDSGSYAIAETTIISDAENDVLSISMNHFSEVSAEIVQEYKDLYEKCGEDICRCMKIKVVQEDNDYLCDGGTCQIIESKVRITYVDCDGETEESFFREVSGICKPEIIVIPAQSVVSPGGQTGITANVKLSCEPSEGQRVDFELLPCSITDRLGPPIFDTTDANGNAETLFKAGDEEGIVTVTARSSHRYFTYTIYASAGGETKIVNGPQIITELTESVDIIISKKWSGTLTFDHFCEWLNKVPASIAESAHYEIDFEFELFYVDDRNETIIEGNASAKQMLNVNLEGLGWNLETYAPTELTLFVGGFVLPYSKALKLWFRKEYNPLPAYEQTPFFNYTICNPARIPPDGCVDLDLFVVILFGERDLENPDLYGYEEIFNIQLVEGTQSGSRGSYNDSWIWNQSYTLTLRRDGVE